MSAVHKPADAARPRIILLRRAH